MPGGSGAIFRNSFAGAMLLLALAVVPARSYASDTIVVVPTRTGGIYQEFIRSFENSLQQNKGEKPVSIRIVEASSLSGEKSSELFGDVRLFVTVGTSAAQKVLNINPPVPVLNTLIPRSSYDHMVATTPRGNTSSIFLDQPLTRRLELVENILPTRKMISVVLGPTTRDLKDELVTVAFGRGMRLRVETMSAGQGLVGPLNRALEDSDAFLAVADPVVSNRRTVQNLLLTTYRQRVPVIAYSKAYVKAGALAAVYSTPEQIGRQTGELVAELVRTGSRSLPKPQYPKYFSVEINDQVAQSLGIRVPSASYIERRLRMREVTP